MFGTANRRPNWHRRPDTVQIQSSSHREDQQPNEAIVKRHTIAPPTLLLGSIPKPRSHYGQGMDISWTTGINGRGSRGGWTQVGKRGRKRGQGGYSSSRGGWGRSDSIQHRSSFDSPGASTSTSVPPGEHIQPIFTTKPLINTRPASPPEALPSQASTFRASNRNHEAPLVAQSMKFKPPLPTRQRFQGKPASAPFPPQPLPHNLSPSPHLITNPSSLPVTLARTPTPPFKRRKVDYALDSHPPIKAEEIEDQGIPQIALSPSPLIKHEDRTPSPPAPPQRRLVTESCSFYPLPVNCQKSNPDYKQNRHALFSREYNILKSLGLQKTKVLFREDGMVIEWKSPTPVWSDTLRPEPSNLSLMIEAALRANSMSSSSKRKSTTPRRSASRSADHHLNNDADTSSSSVKTSSPRREPPSQKPASLSSVPPLPRRRPLPKPKPRSLVKSNISTDTPIATTNSRPEAAQPAESSAQGQVSRPTTRVTSATAWSAGELAEVEPMAISYLQRYIRTFDTDRSLLQGGYVEEAIFSVRVHRSEGGVQANGTSPESDVRFAQGPGLISEALTSLGPHKFCPRGVAGKVLYDVVSLNSGAGGGILLTVHGEVVDEGLDVDSYQAEANTFLITQSFVLQRNRDMDRMELWPLQATSHQMVLRQIGSTGPRLLSTVEATSLEDEFPWLP